MMPEKCWIIMNMVDIYEWIDYVGKMGIE